MTAAAPPTPSKPTVMVVDDVPANISVLLDVLRSDYRLCVAESSESCLEQLPHARADLILLDVKMPGMDGFALCARLQADERWAGIPIIFMTAIDDPEEKRRAFTLGAVDYVTKPIYVPEVEARVRTHLRLRSLQRELEAKNELLEDEVTMRRETEGQLRQSLDQALIAARPDGQVTFISQLAENFLQRYFGRSGRAMLPPALNDAAVGARLEFAHADGKTRLAIDVLASTAGILLQLHEQGRRGPALLGQLGLSARECEVLYWIAEGKTNPEVATILGASVRTVHKHVENIFRKLHVESRFAATKLALEVLD